MTNNLKLSHSEFKKLTKTLIAIHKQALNEEDTLLIKKAESLGYVANNEYTKAGYNALIFSNQMKQPSATFVTQDGYTLTRKNESPACWTDDDLTFVVDEDTGLPMGHDEEPLEGKLTLNLPFVLNVDNEKLNMQFIITKIVDWHEHHFPTWDLVVDESTEEKLNKYTDKVFLTELIACFSAPDYGLTADIELGKDHINYQANYTITTVDPALNDLLNIAPEQGLTMTM